MVANLHANAASAVTLTTTAETVLATITAFNENTAGEFAEGVLIQATVNLTLSAASTAVVLRIRKTGLTGTLVGVAQTVTVTASTTVQLSIDELDTGLVQPGVVYVFTAAVTAASGNSTANRAIITAEDASAFE
jgi:hypothetical protein